MGIDIALILALMILDDDSPFLYFSPFLSHSPKVNEDGNGRLKKEKQARQSL